MALYLLQIFFISDIEVTKKNKWSNSNIPSPLFISKILVKILLSVVFLIIVELHANGMKLSEAVGSNPVEDASIVMLVSLTPVCLRWRFGFVF